MYIIMYNVISFIYFKNKVDYFIQGVRKKTERFELLKNIMLIYATLQH